MPTNIVEGYSRKGDKELAHFVNISLGSLAETKYLLYFAHRLGYIDINEYDEIKMGYEALGKKLWKFYETIKKP
jgi:four helix bundle protein